MKYLQYILYMFAQMAEDPGHGSRTNLLLTLFRPQLELLCRLKMMVTIDFRGRLLIGISGQKVWDAVCQLELSRQ